MVNRIVIMLVLAAVSVSPGYSQTEPVSEITLKDEIISSEKQTGLLKEPHSLKGLYVDHRIFDFGITFDQKPLNHDFSLTNTSDHNIRITEIKTDCGCTAAIVDREELKPGEQTAVRVTLTPERRRGKAEKKITIYTDLPGERNWVEVIVRVETDTIILLKPAHVYFKKVHFGEGATETVQIQPVEGESIDILSANVIEGNLETSLKPIFETDTRVAADESGSTQAVQAATKWELELTLPKDTPAGRFYALIGINTNSPLQPEIVFPVYGLVRSQVSLTPTQCYFGTLKPGDTRKKTLRVEKTGDPTLDEPTVTCDINGISWSIETIEDGLKYSIEVTLNVPKEHVGRLSGELMIKTNDQTQPEFSVPVFGYTPHLEIIESDQSKDISAR